MSKLLRKGIDSASVFEIPDRVAVRKIVALQASKRSARRREIAMPAFFAAFPVVQTHRIRNFRICGSRQNSRSK
jgi:hypothetical protein